MAEKDKLIYTETFINMIGVRAAEIIAGWYPQGEPACECANPYYHETDCLVFIARMNAGELAEEMLIAELEGKDPPLAN